VVYVLGMIFIAAVFFGVLIFVPQIDPRGERDNSR
jgi:hypothetical protein